MNGAVAVQGGLVAPVQGRMRDARVKDDGASGTCEAGEEFDGLLSQGADAAELTEAEPPADEAAAGSRQAATVAAIAGLGFALAMPGEQVAAAAPEVTADPIAALKATLAAAGQQGEATDMPDAAPQDPTIKTDAGSAAEALALLGSATEADTATKPAPVRQSDETTVTIAGAKSETHFAPVAGHHLAMTAPQGPVSDAAALPEAVPDGGETALDTPRGPAVVAQRADSSVFDGKPDSDGARDGGGGDRRPSQAAAVSGAEFAAVAAVAGDAPATSSPAQQIARRIAGELGVGGSVAGARLETTQSGGAGGMTKVLHIQLEPANLGTITVRVSLKDNVLNLHVETARHETALAIEKDRELLSGALKRSGYMVDGIIAQSADVARANAPIQASSGADAQSSFSTSTQSQSGHSQSGQQSEPWNTHTDGNGEDRSSHRRSEPAVGVNDGARGAGRGASGELYV